MEIEKIKLIPIIGYFRAAGQEPTAVRGDNYYYRAFWRNGNNPEAIHVSASKNLWWDNTRQVGGDIIQLVMFIKQVPFKEAVSMLYFDYHESISEIVIRPQDSHVHKLEVVSVRDIFSYPLKNYLAERGISLSVAQKYCQEVRYMCDDRFYYGLGFLTDNNSWIIRSKTFKGCTAAGITTILADCSTSFLVFEGFFSFLSYVQMYGKPKINVIVLNSLTNMTRAYDYFLGATNVYLCLDNDTAGKEKTRLVRAYFGDKVHDKSDVYDGYNDFNDFLTKGDK